MKLSRSIHPLSTVAAGVLAASTVFAAGCADEEKATKKPLVTAPEPMPEPGIELDVDDGSDEVTTGINIDETLAELCGIDKQKTYFEFDSAKLKSQARAMLGEVADCVEEEDVPALVLVGHADPRGSDSYNLWLGQDRADSVASALENSGLEDDELVVRSEGEAQAHDDPSMWDTDRRVDIKIFDGGAPTVETMGQGGTP